MLSLKKNICLLFLLLFSTTSQAQQWVDLMLQPNANYYEISDAFNEEWQGKDYQRGKGWKQFKRWEDFWESRVMEDGTFPMNYNMWDNFKTVLTTPKTKSGGVGNWQPLGPFSHNATGSWSPGSGRVNCITEDPNNSSTLYVGAPVGGIWKSIDSGNSWTPLGDDLSVIGVSGISIDPNNSNIIYICTGDTDGGDSYSIGVMKSIDGGLSWSTSGSVSASKTTEIIIDPTNTNVLYLATSSGVFKSNDSGASWSSVLSGNIRDIDMKPGVASTLYAATSSVLYTSIDGGSTWSSSSTGLPAASGRLAIATTAANNNYVYILSATTGNGFQGVYQSINSGVSFAEMNSTTDIFESSQAWYDMAFACSQTNENELISGVLNLWKSTNSGTDWTAVNNWSTPSDPAYTHADIHFLKYINGSLYCGSDGGIYKSTNNAGSFTDLTDGLQIGQFYRIAGSQNDVNALAGGLQDNGGYAWNGVEWKVYYGADGMEAGVDRNNSNIVFGMIQNGGLYRSTNGGASVSGVGSPESGRWVTPMDMDKNNDRVVAGYTDLHEYNYATGWGQISTFVFPEQLRCVEIYDGNSNTIFVATADNIYQTTDNGVSFIDISGNLPTNSIITSIEVNPTDSTELWITRGGWDNANHVFHTTNGGTTWMNITGNLPNLPCNIVKHDVGTTGGIYVGTDIGVYYWDDVVNIWIQFMNNLPNVIVNDLEINESSNVIRAGTYGRGVWESPNYFMNDYDAAVSSIINPNSNYCNSDSFEPIVTITNVASLDLTSVVINYNVDGGTNQTFNWSGNLLTGESENITLPIITSLPSGQHTFNSFTTLPNGQIDEEPNNDASSKPFTITLNANELTLNLTTDCWGSETTWEIVNSSGASLFSGGPYSDDGSGVNYLIPLCLPDGCYDFIISDSYGDGMFGSQYGSCSVDGNYSIDDLLGGNYVTMPTSDFGSSASHNFCVALSNTLTAYFQSSTQSICAGEMIDFTDISINGTPTSWLWSFDGATILTSTDQNPVGIQYSNSGTFDVQLIVSDGVDTDTISVVNYITVLDNPSITVNTFDTTICSGNSVALTASGATTYSWSNGMTGASINVSPSGQTTYTVTGQTGNCSSTPVDVIVNVDVTPITVADANLYTVVTGQPVNFNSIGTTGTIYSWVFGDGNTSSVSSPTNTFNTIGTYTVILTSTLGNCSSSNTVTIEVGVNGLEENELEENVSIYPNPTDGKFNIQIDNVSEEFEVIVYNSIGKIVRSSSSQQQVVSIDISKEASGIYTLAIIVNENKVYKKITLSH